jgi:predicted nucleic acid-binding protein
VKVTLDANVVLAARDRAEPHFDNSVRCLQNLFRRGTEIHCPWLTITETAATVGRKTRNPRYAARAVAALRQLPNCIFHDLDDATALVAADLAGRLFLRGADAVYAAVAKRSASSLISLDEELCRRAENEVPCFTPARWLRENPAS